MQKLRYKNSVIMMLFNNPTDAEIALLMVADYIEYIKRDNLKLHEEANGDSVENYVKKCIDRKCRNCIYFKNKECTAVMIKTKIGKMTYRQVKKSDYCILWKIKI